MFAVYILCIYAVNGTISTVNLSNNSEIQMMTIDETQAKTSMLEK